MSLLEEDLSAFDDPIDEIVATCIESDPALLDSTVSRVCEAHPEYAEQIRSRIAALRAMGLVRPRSAADERFPERLAEFQLLERLGGGGMGVVFRARQDPLGREVALKVIRPEHLYFPRARERFQRETGAVARLQHPGIVPIYTVGEDAGVPFFAMELVAGCTLGEVIVRLRSRAPETLSGRDLEHAIRGSLAGWAKHRAAEPASFFARTYVQCVASWIADVADALEHAHARGVLHRDVKPSNIAVTLDGRAQLFDFGLARLADRPAQLTVSHMEIGSLLYMSPEQLGRAGDSIDARSDVYSLAVSLYELLALQVPYFDPDPERTRLAIRDGQPDALRARNRSVPRDLEVVCLKAMDRERERRYESAAAFARDLRNALQHRPIEARPPSAWLRARRWVERHPTASVAVGAAALALVGVPSALYLQQQVHALELKDRNVALQAALGETQAQREIARNEARTASETSRFLRDLFAHADPTNARGRDVTVREALDYGADRLEDELADQPLVLASLSDSIGQSYLGIGDYGRAEQLLTRALELRERHAGADSLDVADSLTALAQLERLLARPTALEHARRAAELRRRLSAGPEVATVRALNAYALTLDELGQGEEAAKIYREALTVADGLPTGSRRARAHVIGNLASVLLANGDYQGAIDAAQETIDFEVELFGDRHPGVISMRTKIGEALRKLGRYDEAREIYEESLALQESLYGENDEHYAVLLNNLGAVLGDAGDFEGEVEHRRRAIEILTAVAPPTNINALKCRQGLGSRLAARAQWNDAREAFAELVAIFDQADMLTTGRSVGARVWLAWCDEALGDLEAAERGVARSVERDGDVDAREWQSIAHAQLARWLADRGRLEPAREHAERADVRPEPSSSAAQWTRIAAGSVAQAAGDRARAVEEFSAIAELDRGANLAAWAPALARARLAELLASEDPPSAQSLAERAAAELERALGSRHPQTRRARAQLDAFREPLVK